MGAQGTTVLIVHLDAAGRQEGIELEKSSGNRDLDLAARDAARTWAFAPAIDGAGRPMATAVRTPVNFAFDKPANCVGLTLSNSRQEPQSEFGTSERIVLAFPAPPAHRRGGPAHFQAQWLRVDPGHGPQPGYSPRNAVQELMLPAIQQDWIVMELFPAGGWKPGLHWLELRLNGKLYGATRFQIAGE